MAFRSSRVSSQARSSGSSLNSRLTVINGGVKVNKSLVSVRTKAFPSGGNGNGNHGNQPTPLNGKASPAGASSPAEEVQSAAALARLEIQKKRQREAEDRARAFAEAKAQQGQGSPTTATTQPGNNGHHQTYENNLRSEEIKKEAEARAKAFLDGLNGTEQPPPAPAAAEQANAKAAADAKQLFANVRQNDVARSNEDDVPGFQASTEASIIPTTSAAPTALAPATFQAPEGPANVHFSVQFHAEHGERLVVCGKHRLLGGWDHHKAVTLEWNDGDIWTGAVSLPAADLYDYKYAVIHDHGAVTWEKGVDRILVVEANDISDGIAVSDAWEDSASSMLVTNGVAMSASQKLRECLVQARKDVEVAHASNRALKAELATKDIALRQQAKEAREALARASEVAEAALATAAAPTAMSRSDALKRAEDALERAEAALSRIGV